MLVAPQDLVTLGTGILTSIGVPEQDARLPADSLVTPSCGDIRRTGCCACRTYRVAG